MKFLFFPQSCLPFHGKSLEERPLGGIETGVIRLSSALAEMGHDVIVLSQVENPPLTTPLYLPFRVLEEIGPVDVLIAVRDWAPLILPLPAKLKLFWTGDSYDQPQGVGIGDKRVAEKIDAFLSVSDWHKATYCAESGFPKEKTWSIKNGVTLKHFEGTEGRARRRLIYSSTPYRGLQFVPPLYAHLRSKFPDLELHVFSGYAVYAGSEPPPLAAVKEFEAVAQQLRTMPGCHLHGNVRQEELAREFMKSSLLFYPNTFVETSCITAMEAQAAGCPIVSTDLGALRETVGNAGVLIAGRPGSADYGQKFVAAAENLLTNDTIWRQLSENGLKRSREFDWSNVATRLLGHISTAIQGR